MTCEQALTLLSAGLDGALSPAERAALEAHLADCPDCRRLRESLTRLEKQVAALREPAPAGLKRGVLYRIDQATGKAKPTRSRWFGPGTALGAVAAVLILLVGLNVIPLRNGYQAAMPAATRAAGAAETAAPDTAKDWDAPSIAGSPDAAWAPNSDKAADREPQANGEDSATRSPADYPEAPTSAPAEESFADSAWLNAAPKAVTEDLRAACAALSARENVAVLLYTEFDLESLLSLLETEEPDLYKLLADLEPESAEALTLCKTDCGTILALQEWLLQNLPQAEVMAPGLREAETGLMIRMEALDPGSASLNRVITWTRRDHAIQWPAAWPEGWADRLRTEENWSLFFPTEDYVPNSDKPAYLAFAP